MRFLRTVVVWLLVVGLSTSALAGDLQTSLPRAAHQQTQPQTAGDLRTSIVNAVAEQAQSGGGSMPKGYLWAGTALFVGGMAAGLYGFLNNKNGAFPEFGEAEATNKYLGTAGLVTAFVGGTVLVLGARRAPSVTVGPGRVTVSKQVSW